MNVRVKYGELDNQTGKMRTDAVILTVLLLAGPFWILFDQGEGIPSQFDEDKDLGIYMEEDLPMVRSSVSGNLTDHDPIVINNETDLEDLMFKESWPGNGTEEDPYIIEDLEIDAEGESMAIFMGNTSSYIQFINCDISNTSSTHSFNIAIFLWNVSNVSIESCFIHNSEYGVMIREAHYLYLNNINFSDCDIGFGSGYSKPVSRITVDNCTFSPSIYDAIEIDTGSFLSVVNSSFTSTGNAIDFRVCDNITLSGNEFDDCENAIRIS